MLSPALKKRLADPAYLDLHLTAAAVVRKIKDAPWYDSIFLNKFEAAKQYLEIVRPDALDAFVVGFAPLHTPRDFAVKKIANVFPDETHERIRQVVATLPSEQLELHEVQNFGRNIVHDQSYFVELQQELTPLVSDLAGQEVEAGYNFLSLYGSDGKCAPHLDQPISMYTLDFCIDRRGDWPIYFSDVIDWPTAETIKGWRPESVLGDRSIQFSSSVLQPNEAILFAGSSQWHYRESMPPGGYCNLLFFHYYPAGCGDLVRSGGWPRFFDLPELEPLCDLFAEVYCGVE